MKLFQTLAIAAVLPIAALAEPVVIEADGSVADTVARLSASVEGAGARVFHIVDFGGGARSIGSDVGDIQLVIFGNPAIGAAALSADRMAALDLPAKVLVYGTDAGTFMAYEQPAEMLAASPKGTVPVLVLPTGQVIDESLDIMRWALASADPDDWLSAESDELIRRNDTVFKPLLDRYKYSDRHPERSQLDYRREAEVILAELDSLLTSRQYLLADSISLADVALFPFVRQFAFVDKQWFVNSPYTHLKRWLSAFLESACFNDVMAKYSPWRPGADPIVFGQ